MNPAPAPAWMILSSASITRSSNHVPYTSDT